MEHHLVTVLWTLCFFKTLTSANSPCGDWVPYRDEACFKLVERAGLQTKKDAELVCQAFAEELHQEEIPKLINVKTKEKQEFLQVLFTEHRTFDNIWLGLDIGSDAAFRWNAGTALFYTNWAVQDTTDKERQCVQMESGEGSYQVGKWVRVNCQKKNAIVCERTQPWSVTRLQKSLLNLKLELERSRVEADQKVKEVKEEADQKVKKVKEEADQKIIIVRQELQTVEQQVEQKINSVNQEILAVKQEASRGLDTLRRNPVPVGFVYGQFPGQQPPNVIWPLVKWEDVSSNYAGNFFRVVGGNSAAFGEVQNGDSPRLITVQTGWRENPTVPLISTPADGSWSQFVYTTDSGTVPNQPSLRFQVSSTEVRPQNQAVKVWQRSG